MKSFTAPAFWQAYRKLPEQVRKQARASYRLFAADPSHPSLRFKKVSRRRPIYSVKVNLEYRALGILDDDEIVWFWIGPHDEYDRLLKQL